MLAIAQAHSTATPIFRLLNYNRPHLVDRGPLPCLKFSIPDPANVYKHRALSLLGTQSALDNFGCGDVGWKDWGENKPK